MSTTDFLAARPQVRPDVVVGAAQQRGPVRFHLVKRLEDGLSFEVGAKEQFIISRLDGSCTLAEISAAYQRQFGRGLGPANWGQILGTLHQRDLLAGGPASATQQRRAESAPRRPGRHRRVSRRVLGGSARLVSHPAQLLDRVHAVLRFTFSAWFVLPAVLLSAVMLWSLAGDAGELARASVRVAQDPGSMMLVVVATWAGAALHELAHGLAARHYGVPVVEIGLRWLLPLVVLYCRVDDYLFLRTRRSQVAVAGAGVLANLVLLLPLFLVRQWADPQGAPGDVLASLLLLGTALAVLNLLPLPPLDGYLMLSHALGMSHFARHSMAFAAAAVQGDRELTHRYPRGARRAYTAYAVGLLLSVVGTAIALVVLGHRWTGSWLWPSLVVLSPVPLVVLSLVGMAAGRRRTRRGEAAAPATPAVPAPPVGLEPAGPAIVLRDVQKRYGERRAVDGVSLEVTPGEFLGLLGPNGAGKTTLVEIAVGLRSADGGSVSLLGRPPRPRDAALLSRIGVQTQAAAFFVRLTAREHLRTVAALYGLGPSAADRALRLVGLGDLAEVRGERLSGGQRQRLAIAAALVHDPELIFLDEPTAALDPQARRALWQVLRDLHVAGRTIVYTTHHLDEAEALCDRVAIIADGRIVALDSPQRLVAATGVPTRLAVPRDRLSTAQALAIPGVTGARVEGGAVVLDAVDTTSVLSHLGSITGLHGVQTRSATLEDVYLELTGTDPA